MVITKEDNKRNELYALGRLGWTYNETEGRWHHTNGGSTCSKDLLIKIEDLPIDHEISFGNIISNLMELPYNLSMELPDSQSMDLPDNPLIGVIKIDQTYANYSTIATKLTKELLLEAYYRLDHGEEYLQNEND